MALRPLQVAVVTGAAGGIGYAVASQCASLGMRVCLADINAEALDDAKKRLEAEITEQTAEIKEQMAGPGRNEPVMAQVLDVTSPDSYARLRDAILEKWGHHIGFVFLNAGILAGGGALSSTLDDWASNVNVNLMGVVHGVQAFVPTMKAQGDACAIAATASWAGLFNAYPYASVPYVATKHGCVLLMEALCHELRQEHSSLTAHVLCPAQVNTNMLKGIGPDRVDNRSEQELQVAESRTKFAMQPSEMAQVLFDAVRAGKFYVLGHDPQQPLPWLKELNALRSEDIRMERPPLAHLSDHGDARALQQRLRDVRQASKL